MNLSPVDTSGFGSYAGPVLRAEDGGAFEFEIAERHLNGADRLAWRA